MKNSVVRLPRLLFLTQSQWSRAQGGPTALAASLLCVTDEPLPDDSPRTHIKHTCGVCVCVCACVTVWHGVYSVTVLPDGNILETRKKKQINQKNTRKKTYRSAVFFCFIKPFFYPQVSATKPFSRFLLFYPYRH